MITSSLLMLLALAAGPVAEAPFQDIAFDQALAAAKKEQKIVMVDFFTTWCVPCKKLDKITWKDAGVQAWIAKTAVALKIDAEKEAELAKRFKIEAYPTILFVKADGTEIDRMIGFKEPADFIQEANSALAGKDAVARAKEKMGGQANSPSERMRLAKALAQKEQYAEALAEYLWCFDHGVEAEPSFSAVRVSFLLSYIAALGGKYPPAIQALEERRDAAEKAVDSGAQGVRAAGDFANLNKYLRTPERTLALYDRLRKDGKLTPELKTTLFHHVLDSLIAARRYVDVIEATGDAEAAAKRSIARYDEQKRMLQERADPSDEPDGAADFMKQRTVDDVAKYYEAALGAEQVKTAEAIADRLFAFDAGAMTYVALVEHALRAGNDAAAHGLAERGMKALDEKGRERLKLAANKIPEKK